MKIKETSLSHLVVAKQRVHGKQWGKVECFRYFSKEVTSVSVKCGFIPIQEHRQGELWNLMHCKDITGEVFLQS